jgi:hypothetical protein
MAKWLVRACTAEGRSMMKKQEEKKKGDDAQQLKI